LILLKNNKKEAVNNVSLFFVALLLSILFFGEITLAMVFI